MLTELRVRDLGVIADLTLLFEPGMTALTGETGAGKTLVVEAIELLLGGRADPVLVRPGATEALVEGRFVVGDDEIVLARALPAAGRSRAYLDGTMATVAALAAAGERLVDLHGQHAHQSLLRPAAARRSLDRFAGIDLAGLLAARARLADLDRQLAELGGDARARAREIDLLRFQMGEIDGSRIADPDEEIDLEQEETVLADVSASRQAAALAHELLSGDGGAADAIGQAIAAVAPRPPLAEHTARLKAVAADLLDAASELRDAGEGLTDDPERLDAVTARRHLLRDLRRKYGESLAEVMRFGDDSRRRLAELESYEQRAATLEHERAGALAEITAAEAAVGRARRAAAPDLARAIETTLHELALPRARFEVRVGSVDPGDDVVFGFGANPGEAVLPLTKVASGGELARVMLAVRLVLTGVAQPADAVGAGWDGPGTDGPATLIFDEVDAGVGGEAAVAVGRALAALGPHYQVVVVTHLPQVAAYADTQVGVTKVEAGGRTVASAAVLDPTARVVELSRMLSGQPDSATARRHAEELLAGAAQGTNARLVRSRAGSTSGRRPVRSRRSRA